MSETFYATKSFHGSDHSFPGLQACYPWHWLRLVPDTAKPFSPHCALGHHSMSSASESPFKPPPIVECVSGTHCLGIGKKVYVPHRVCSDCLQRHDPQQLRIWANSNPAALLLINEETARKHVLKRNIEARGRYLCAFEDPDYQLCRWRLLDLNLRGTRLDCPSVRRKGTACSKCWRKRLRKISVVQHFTPAGLCHDEADRVVTRLEALLMHDLIAMLAPPPKPHCAFGPACDSRPEGQEHGPEICSWCRNLSIDALFKQADKLSDNRSLKRLIHEYMRQLEREHTERVRKGWSFLCACKDPEYRSQSWRIVFNPRDSRACGTVRYRGQLCARCFSKAQDQECPWLEQFDGDRLGFPCAFEDPRLRRPVDTNWKLGPLDARGKPDPSWEKDPRKDGRFTTPRDKVLSLLAATVLSQLATIALPHPATTVSPNMEPREHLDKKMLKEIDTNFNDAIKKTPSTPSTPKHEIDSLSSCCPEFADPDRCIARLRQHSQNGDPCLACSIAHPRLLRLIHGFKSETNDHILAIIERQHTFTMPGQYACVSRHPRYHYFDKKVPAWMDKLIDARINRDAGNILYSTQIQCPTLACEEELCPPCLSALRLRAPEMVEALYQSTVYFSRFGKLVPTCGIHSPPGEHYNFSPA
ncbi:conserved hypothetical protein [Pyrenophora tritici-repentis Pt-1C-BFP]|uniref:Uncharacterized protein n=2 Tax=Pyrenophora tritici-repentis TaxID=45151 RepID=B2W652_PYRTR|nr:uncharacterized protein PTRG_06210 [Pyrenophora tritici-repentis Pt-1C-BFP]EDU49130.1 conserved hypothetical protein [Pyrenophora tritici-repentis Pt-1C-BFP]